MQIVEQKIVGKKSLATCEDTIVVTPDFVAVIDGSTSKTDKRISDHYSNGQLCARTVGHCIATMDSATDCRGFCQIVTHQVAALYSKSQRAQLQAHPHLRATASAVIYSRLRHEVWLVGDCQCRIDGQLYTNEKPSEHAIALERARVIRQALDRGLYTVDELRRHDYGRDAIYQQLIDATQGQNRDYAVIDGFDIALSHVPILAGGHHMVLASDGYPTLYDTLVESERQLSDLLHSDPLCIGPCCATKGWMEGANSFDDRSYVSFTV